MIRVLTLSFSFLILFAACTPKVKDAGVDYFAKANTLKSATERMEASNNAAIQDLQQRRNNIMVQGRTLTTKELKFIDEVNALLTEQGKFQQFMDDIAKSESAYESNGKELLYLNEQANQLAKKIQRKIAKLQ